MHAVFMPEEYVEPPKRTIKEMRIGEVAWIDFTEVYVDAKTKRTYVHKAAKLKGPSVLFRVRVQREADGYRLAFAEADDTNPGFTFMPLPRIYRSNVAPIIAIEVMNRANLESDSQSS